MSRTHSPDPAHTVVAQAVTPRVAIHDGAGGKRNATLSNPTEVGGPLVFVVKAEVGEWLEVHLPLRPNGSTGWIKRGDVTLSRHFFRIVIELGAHRIRVLHGNGNQLDEPIAVGKRDTPTPTGFYYVKELLQPPDPGGPYGTYAFGLSGFSNKLSSFRGGEAVVGIHGTNDPGAIGTDVSFGCIRMRNEAISRLVGLIPLGTPVDIRP